VVIYFIGFSAGWLLWFASLWVPVPTRPVLWVTALGIELSTPWLGRHWLIRHPVHRSHLPERIGQFIIILLGGSLANLLALTATIITGYAFSITNEIGQARAEVGGGPGY
jgi:low temperature requirement protein LtrA